MQRANTIVVDPRVTPMDPPGDAEVGATEQRVPAIAFPKSDRVDASGAGDAYGDGAAAIIRASGELQEARGGIGEFCACIDTGMAGCRRPVRLAAFMLAVDRV